MENNWQCKFKNHPEEITVGQKLLLICDGGEKINLKKPLRIEFLDKKYDYSLHVLKTLKTEDYFLALEVVPYRTGKFKQDFIITDGKQDLVINDFSFSVQSVLKPNTKIYGPFGPFKSPIPLSYFALMLFSFSCLVFCIFVFFNRWLKRKNYIQKILDRKTHLNPSKSFIMGLRQQTYSIEKLEILFRTFLEDCLFIPAIDKSTKQIMKSLKTLQPSIYKKEGQALYQILNEFSSLDYDKEDKKTFLKLKKVCQNMVFLLDKTKEKK